MDRLFPVGAEDPRESPARLSFAVNGGRLQASLVALSRFGPHPDGGAARLAFSEADLAARAWLTGEMRTAGLSVRTDAAGNLFARREGRENLPVILFGSHMDTVPRGGHYDGALGVLAALEVLRSLDEQSVATRHPLEMVVWCDEEGAHFGNGLFGSRAATSGAPEEEFHRMDRDGRSLADWMDRYRLDPRRIGRAVLDPRTVRAVVELHVEQGGTLERQGARIGVVDGIVGIHRFEARIRGIQNHAGTTPMAERRDALLTAARLIVATHEEIRRLPGGQVGNVGQIAVTPDAANVVPGEVRFPIEMRDLDDTVVAGMIGRIGERSAALARETGCRIGIERTLEEPAAWMDPGLRALVAREARALDHDPVPMPSRAGHDAQNTARHGIPTAMIFVPSRDGISHAPAEWTSWDDCALGAEMLRRTVLAIDRR